MTRHKMTILAKDTGLDKINHYQLLRRDYTARNLDTGQKDTFNKM